MQPCFDFRNGFSCDICVDLQPVPRPQEKRTFSGQFKSCIFLRETWHHAFILSVNRHARKSHIQCSIRTHRGTEGQLEGAVAGPARSSRRKSTLLADPSLLDEKEFLQQMRGVQLDRRFSLFLGLSCMLFHNSFCASARISWSSRVL